MTFGVFGVLNQFCSENLGAETAKGKLERKRKEPPSGLLPFGIVAGSDGVPVRDDRTFCVLERGERDGRRGVVGGRETSNYEGRCSRSRRPSGAIPITTARRR